MKIFIFNCKRVVSTQWGSIGSLDPYIKEESGFCNFVPYTRLKFSYKYTDIHSNLSILPSNPISNIWQALTLASDGLSAVENSIVGDLIRPKIR